jgi:hypothetical protein
MSRSLRPQRHPYEVGIATSVLTRVEDPHEHVRVFKVLADSLDIMIPVPDSVPNGWAIRMNHCLILQPKSTNLYKTGLQFQLPAGLVGVISRHPVDFEDYISIEPVYLHEHLPNNGVTLRIFNHSDRQAVLEIGKFVALLHFHRSSRVELEQEDPFRMTVARPRTRGPPSPAHSPPSHGDDEDSDSGLSRPWRPKNQKTYPLVVVQKEGAPGRETCRH